MPLGKSGGTRSAVQNCYNPQGDLISCVILLTDAGLYFSGGGGLKYKEHVNNNKYKIISFYFIYIHHNYRLHTKTSISNFTKIHETSYI